MAILDIVLYPDEVLREECAPVTKVTDEIRALLDDMAETMYDAPGIGLAAPQVGRTERVMVVDVGDDSETGQKAKLYKIVNPEIVGKRGSVLSREGCLSIPEVRESVTRAEFIQLKALDENGKPFSLDVGGMLAIALQHEIDHLNGVLFIDYLSALKRKLVKNKLVRLEKLK